MPLVVEIAEALNLLGIKTNRGRGFAPSYIQWLSKTAKFGLNGGAPAATGT